MGGEWLEEFVDLFLLNVVNALVRPFWCVTFINEGTSNTLKEIRSVHKSLADSEVVYETLFGGHFL
jgi:hypothetical protein